jgi:hypothetical protein
MIGITSPSFDWSAIKPSRSLLRTVERALPAHKLEAMNAYAAGELKTTPADVDSHLSYRRPMPRPHKLLGRKLQVSPDRAVSVARRRMLGSDGTMPNTIANLT